MEEKKGILGKILAFIGIVVAIGGAVLAVLHFWDDIKEKLGLNKCDIEELGDFVEDEIEDLGEIAEDVEDEMEDFVEFEEI